MSSHINDVGSCVLKASVVPISRQPFPRDSNDKDPGGHVR